MSFAEIVLRLGVTFVSWLVIYMHLIMLFVLRYAQCPDTSAWRVSLVSAVFTGAAALGLRYGHAVEGAGSTLRYFALPLVLLLPWTIWICLPYLMGTSFTGTGLCAVLSGGTDPGEIPGWQRLWAPIQLLVLSLVGWQAWQAWSNKSPELAAS